MLASQDAETVYICDWLPPDFGAVGQYSLLFAKELAESGERVVIVGLTSQDARTERVATTRGSLTIVRIRADSYDKTKRMARLIWTARINTRLLGAAWRHMRRARRVIFTGSPPLFLHWIAPANLWLRKTLTYRITDFHPECAMAEVDRPGPGLRLLQAVTLFWRRRVDRFEVLGRDQARRLEEQGIARSRVQLKRDPSPVEISETTAPLERPAGANGKTLLLYSGNWGVAHDTETFLHAYRYHHWHDSGDVVLWLNAVGGGAARVAQALEQDGLPFIQGTPVPLEQLASLLVTPDAHLITLSDPFVGYVLPSKVYGCVASRKPVLFIGSEASDVHALCEEQLGNNYFRSATGDVAACAGALQMIGKLSGAGTKAALLAIRGNGHA
ncbi:MAG: hypothetical protein AAF732_01595 [Pseudomonadota bacterium]